MSKLNNEHIEYIIKDLQYRGIVLENFRDEVVDHVCSAVESEMEKGKRFYDAYQGVVKSFGNTSGLQKTQKETLRSENSTSKTMLRNYLKIAMRNLSKYRFYTFINITGLATGVAACLLIALYMTHELSYDKHFKNADRIYRMHSEFLYNGNHFNSSTTPPPAARALAFEFPEVEASVQFRTWGWRWVKRNTENFKEQYMGYASNDIFKVFSLPLIKGNTSNALVDPSSLVISKSKAEKYFPGEEALGQALIIDDKSYTITGVFEDFPETTHFRFDFIQSMEGFEESKSEVWTSNNSYHTYILLREGSTAKDVEAKFPKLIEKYVAPQIVSFFGPDFTMEKYYASGNKIAYSLMAVTDIHLHSNLIAEIGVNSDITYIYLFGAIALFILGIACINFMNLSTARSANRAKEVGVRKVLGSLRSHLIRQFLTESVLLSSAAFIVAASLAYLLLPGFNTLSGRSLSIPFASPVFIFSMISGALLIGLAAGLYPSFFLSSFKPVQVLKGKISMGMKSGAVRSSLVVFQFMISIFLVIGTITVQKQLDFIQNKKVGFDKDQVVIIHNTETLGTHHEAFKNELLKNPMITNVSVAGYIPISGWARTDASFWPEGKQPSQDNLVNMQAWRVDHEYVPTMGMKIIEGRNFSVDFKSDSSAVILNESAVKHFGLKNPLGQKITSFSFSEDNSVEKNATQSWTIVGVVSDFHFESLRQNITPLCLFLGQSNWSMPVRFQSENTAEVISGIEKTWKSFNAGKPFEYNFLNEAFGNMYSAEKRLGNIFGIFAALAIIIACLGLFALTAFTAEQRTKEIGIRKVLGASVPSIIILLSKEFGKLILIAFLISAPLAWWAVDWWLENYTYKVEVGLLVYIAAGAFAFLVAWLTMGYQSVKAATANPVTSLRNE